MAAIIHGYVRPDRKGFLGECPEFSLKTRAGSLEEIVHQLHQTVREHLDKQQGNDLAGAQLLITFYFTPIPFDDLV